MSRVDDRQLRGPWWWDSNPVYGDFRIPNDWGSGALRSCLSRAAGGGFVHIAAETFLLDGDVKARGGWQSAAGGGIYISVDTLDGAGNIAADGANGGTRGARRWRTGRGLCI